MLEDELRAAHSAYPLGTYKARLKLSLPTCGTGASVLGISSQRTTLPIVVADVTLPMNTA